MGRLRVTDQCSFQAHDHPSGGCASQKLAGRKLLILRRAAEFLESAKALAKCRLQNPGLEPPG